MNETTVLINRAEVSWSCWEYLCLKCGADAFKTRSLILYVDRSKAEGYQDPVEVQN